MSAISHHGGVSPGEAVRGAEAGAHAGAEALGAGARAGQGHHTLVPLPPPSGDLIRHRLPL